MDKIGKYRIVEDLMTTGFSDIYIGEADGIDGELAIKVFHPKDKNTGDEAQYGEEFWRERFIEEGKLLTRLDHPNIVKAIDIGVTDAGEPYIVMPYMEANLLYEIGEDQEEGEELEDIPKKWRPRAITPRRAAEVWRQILDALAHMHADGLVHRDIKPQNILLTTKRDGQVKLCDFGMVKVPDAQGSRSGIWIGTLSYISPEQRRSAADVDVRSDVFSAGVVMYRMLTGTLPPDKIPPLRAGRFGIPQALCKLIDDCMWRKISKRPADAGVVLERFDKIVPDINSLPDRSKIIKRAASVRVITRKAN